MARVAVGNPAPSPKPNARRTTNNDATPVVVLVTIVDSATIAQQSASVRRAPSRSPIQPPISWKTAYGMAKAENTRPSCVFVMPSSVLTSGATVERLTRLTKYRKYIAHSSISTTAGGPGRRDGRCALTWRHHAAPSASPSGSGLALDLCAVKDAAAVRVEGVAAVHRAPVIPENEVADLPLEVP